MAIVTVTEIIGFISEVFGKGTLDRSSRNFDVRCPKCDPVDKEKRKLSFLIPDAVAHCWVCGLVGTLQQLTRRYGTAEQWRECKERFPRGDQADELLAPEDPVPSRVELPSDYRLLATSTFRDPDDLAALKYLANRRVTKRDMWYFKLGTSNQHRWRRRVLFPSFDAEGNLNYLVGRSIDPKAGQNGIKRYITPDVNKYPVVFNAVNIDWSKELVLCEGPFDLIKCPENSVPLLGSDLNKQMELFSIIAVHKTPIVLVLDDDMRLTKVPKIVQLLSPYDVPVRVARLPEGADPGSMSRVDVKRAIHGARTPSWEDTFKDRLEVAVQVSL